MTLAIKFSNKFLLEKSVEIRDSFIFLIEIEQKKVSHDFLKCFFRYLSGFENNLQYGSYFRDKTLF